VPLWSGQQVVSALLPAVYLAMGNKVWDEEKGRSDPNYVIINNGTIQQGVLDGDIFDKALIHILYNDFSPEMTVDFIDSLQSVVATYLQNSGFSVGLSDLIADEGTLGTIAEDMNKLKKQIESLQLQVHMGLFDNASGRTNQEEFEGKVFQTLDKVIGAAGKTGLKSLATNNRMVNMVKCGSKGADLNIAQMIALLGQQSIEGKRIAYGFQDRTLPHFKRYDDGAEARGFIESSFVKGLTPAEFFFHAMTGREGLIDTAVKTADSGYMQRQLVKTMEDLMTWHDGTVRDAGGLLVQFAYGDDGTSATKIENQPIGLGRMNDTEIRAKFSVEDVAAERSQSHLTQIFADRDILVQNVWSGRVDKTVQSAVHLPRLIANAVVQLGLVAGQGTPVTGAHVLDTVTAILKRTRPDNRLWGALLRFHLNPRDLVALGFTQSAFDWLAEQIVVKHMKSWVAPGEMAGIIAAQSLGEPTTQMSSHKETWISVRNLKNVSQSFTGKVGSFIDKIMTQNATSVMRHGDSEALNIGPEWAIMGVSNDEKTSWMPISQVSRHPANGGLVKVTTKSGRTTTATLSHSFLRRTTTGITEIKGSDLRNGQRIPVATRQPVPEDALKMYKGFALTKDFGWLVGIYLADGSFNHNIVSICKIHPVVEERIRALATDYDWKVTVRNYQGAYGPSKNTNIHDAHLKAVLMELCNTGSFDKCLAAPIFHANKEFIAGLLSGYFDGDGNVNAQRQQIRVGSRSQQLIRDIARLLPVCGVFGTLCEEKSVRIPDQVMYTLNVLRKHAAIFQREVGLYLTEKAAALQEIVDYNARTDNHSLKEEIDMIPELGDVIAETGRLLKMPGQSRTYGRYGSDRVVKKAAIGRRTLEAYIGEFREMMQICLDPAVADKVTANLAILESAATSDIIWDEITELEILDDPHELVYDFTVPGNDSFMVDDSIFVHNTLNSVDWDTEILLAKDGKIQAPRIGEFIDNYIAACDPAKVQHLPNDQLYVALDDGHDWQAVSCDEDGKMQWTKLEAITKHPVVNEDGTNTILEVTLESGRTVKATKGLSFLTLRDNKIVDLRGSDLVIGDCLPIANTLAIHELGLIEEIDLATVLPPTEWLYGTEVAKALATMHAADESGNRHWFSKANGSAFTVPYARSDSFRDAFTHGKNMHAADIKPGYVYPKKLWTKISQIPDTIPLDRAFGFFCGAYVAEGSTSPTQIQITNNDDAFLTPIRTLLDKWAIGHHTVSCDKEIAKTGIRGHTQSLVIHSTLLTAAMKAMFGGISYEKTLPDWVLQAPDDFVKGLIDGYFSGDGSVSKQRTIVASSVSDALITRLMALLTRYGIFATRSNHMPNIRKFNNVNRQYALYIPQKYAHVFATIFTLTIAHKQDRLNAIKTLNIDSKCKKPEFADMIMDRVLTVRDTLPKGGRMYDLTVEKTRNFTTLSCLAQKDTFHLSGVAAKSGMTRGVPRLKELLKATQNPKATSLTIHLRPDIRKSKEEARRLAQELEFTMLKDLVTVSRIYYDPRDSDTLVGDDTEWLSFFAAFEQSEEGDEAPKSPWIIRLELDREKMFNKNITMDDIGFVLRRASAAANGNPIELTYTDHNAAHMVFRIRLILNKQDGKPPLDDLTIVKQVQNRLLTQTLVRGLPGLRSVSFRMLKDEIYEKNPANDNKYESADQFVLDTFGTNFLDVLVHPDVDGSKLISNHVHDIYENLGIEAARMILFREIFGLFEQAAPVNYRHVAILCDAMCNRGRLVSADRIGVNKKVKIGALAKSSFEQASDIMLRAALFGEMDPVTGVSASIMTGQPIRGGTTFTQVLLDEAALLDFTQSAPPPRKSIERAPGLVQQQIDEMLEAKEAPGCRQADLRIPAALPPMDPLSTAEGDLPDLEIQLVDE
jgi:DNA-directed RNA polymerase beta' subunit